MTLDQAHAVLTFYGQEYEIRNIWEILSHMENNLNRLDNQEYTAYNIINVDLKYSMQHTD